MNRKHAENQLEALLLEGLDTGETIEITPAFWKELKAEAASLLKKQAPRPASKHKKG